MTYSTLNLSHSGTLAVMHLNQPEVRNAFNETAIAEITDAFRFLGAHGSVRAIILAANGPAFCAGADLNWMKKVAGYSHEQNRTDAAQLAEMLRTIYTCPKPVLAKVHGDCYAGGMGLVAACDIAVAADGANFCLSEVKLGLIPATISPYVIKAMGENAARRYFITGERFSAIEAHRIGFIHEVVKPDLLDASVDDIVKELMSAGPNAVGEAKRLVRKIGGTPCDDALIADTVERIAAIRSSVEGREGVRAFLEKRKPSWHI